MDANDILMNIYPNTTKNVFNDIYNQVNDRIGFMKAAEDIEDIINCRESLNHLLPILFEMFDFINKHMAYLIKVNDYNRIIMYKKIFINNF